jgi:hypothetical protein
MLEVLNGPETWTLGSRGVYKCKCLKRSGISATKNGMRGHSRINFGNIISLMLCGYCPLLRMWHLILRHTPLYTEHGARSIRGYITRKYTPQAQCLQLHTKAARIPS